ncbi:MAG TPA: MFS transporter [Caulobacteraceae bacterium]|nr:MFS transporter [Caulobacteraceae bacterium]
METRPNWIGAPPGPLRASASLAVGVNGIMIAGLQPLLLGALQLAHRLSAAELGRAATAELLTMGAVAGLAGLFLPPRHLRPLGVLACLVLAGLDVATTRADGATITLLRGAAGIPSGVMMWLTISMITRAPRPEQWSALFLTVQTLGQFVLSAVISAFVIGRFGPNGGFFALAGVSVIAAGAALIAPPSLAPLAHAETPGGLPTPAGAAALLAAFLFLAFQFGVWVYAEPLSHQAGHVPQVAETAISLSLAFQVLGSGAATFLAHRLPWFRTLLVLSLASLGCLAGFAALPGPLLFLVDAAVFGFLWLFLLPFLVPMTIAADPTRRSAVLLGGAQLLGGSLGPLLSSLVVSDADARGAVVLGAISLIAAMVIVAALHIRRPRAPALA